MEGSSCGNRIPAPEQLRWRLLWPGIVSAGLLAIVFLARVLAGVVGLEFWLTPWVAFFSFWGFLSGLWRRRKHGSSRSVSVLVSLSLLPWFVAAAVAVGQLRLPNLDSPRVVHPIAQIPLPGSFHQQSIAFSPDGSALAVGGELMPPPGIPASTASGAENASGEPRMYVAILDCDTRSIRLQLAPQSGYAQFAMGGRVLITGG